MKLIDLAAQYQNIQSAMDAAISKVLQHGQFILGPEVAALEQELANYVGVKHVITMSSGTTALQVALMALNVGPGDEVITSPFSFFGTVEVILLLGATPVFVDINPKTYNLDPELLAAAITKNTKAIMPVSLYGQCADYAAINQIAKDIPVIEDAAQSFGAKYKEKYSCGLTTIACTSFFPSKPLGGYGEGGACFTNDDDLALNMRMIMNHGQRQRYEHVLVGLNGRFDTLQAAIVLTKLRGQFAGEIQARQQVAKWYQQYLPESGITPAYVEPYNLSVYAQYTVRVSDRASYIKNLQEQDIPTAVHYPKPLHQQAALPNYYHQQVFPHAEKAAQEVLSLPFHPYMREEEVKQVAAVLETVLTSSSVVG